MEQDLTIEQIDPSIPDSNNISLGLQTSPTLKGRLPHHLCHVGVLLRGDVDGDKVQNGMLLLLLMRERCSLSPGSLPILPGFQGIRALLLEAQPWMPFLLLGGPSGPLQPSHLSP